MFITYLGLARSLHLAHNLADLPMSYWGFKANQSRRTCCSSRSRRTAARRAEDQDIHGHNPSFQHVVCRKLRRTNIILNRFKMIQELQYLHETAFYINLFTCKVAVARSEACKRPKQWLLGIVSESESCRISNELLAETCLI